MNNKEPELKIEIDDFHLDREWLNQPVQYYAWCVQLADARLEVDRIKAKLDVARAEIVKEIREKPEDFGIAKLTEAAIDAMVVIQPEYKKVYEEQIQAKHRHGVVEAAVNALGQRKTALENLVYLYTSSYFAEPKAASAAKEEVAEWEKQDIRTRWKRRREEARDNDVT